MDEIQRIVVHVSDLPDGVAPRSPQGAAWAQSDAIGREEDPLLVNLHSYGIAGHGPLGLSALLRRGHKGLFALDHKLAWIGPVPLAIGAPGPSAEEDGDGELTESDGSRGNVR